MSPIAVTIVGALPLLTLLDPTAPAERTGADSEGQNPAAAASPSEPVTPPVVQPKSAAPDADSERKEAKRPRRRVVHPNPKQPWLRADEFTVSTVGGAPKVRIRFRNEHEEKTADDVKTLGWGTARDDFGIEYKVFTPAMPETLAPRTEYHAEYSLLPKLTANTAALLLLLNPLEDRVVHVELRLREKEWEIEEYGFWKEDNAYANQNEWAEEQQKENPYKQAAAVVRVWKDESGEFSVSASFDGFHLDRNTGKSTVTLKRADDGKIIEVPHLRLSAEDRKYIRELKRDKDKDKDNGKGKGKDQDERRREK